MRQSGCNSRWIESSRRESNTVRKPKGKSSLAIQRAYSSSLGGKTADGWEEWTQGREQVRQQLWAMFLKTALYFTDEETPTY